MSHEPVKLYAAAVIRRADGLVLLTRHDARSKWHFPDGVPRAGESCWEALKHALQDDLPGTYVKLEVHPYEVTEIISKSVRHMTLHYVGTLISSASLTRREPMDLAWMELDGALDCYLSTHIMLDRLRTKASDRR